MAVTAGFRLRVEPLKAGHLAQIASVPDACSTIQNSVLQSLLVQSWLSRLDQLLPDPLNPRLTRVLALIESSSESADRIGSLLLMRSSNRRNSCASDAEGQALQQTLRAFHGSRCSRGGLPVRYFSRLYCRVLCPVV